MRIIEHIPFALRCIVWFVFLISVLIACGKASSIIARGPSAIQEVSVFTGGLFDVVTSFFIAFVLDKGLSVIDGFTVVRTPPRPE